MDVVKIYCEMCQESGIPFELVGSPKSYDDTTLFCPAGMQQYKGLFADELVAGKTIANIQPCIRLTDIESIGDGSHAILFNMIGLFSFRHWPLEKAIRFFHEFVQRCGIVVSHVTIHPDRESWSGYHPHGTEVKLDENCKWSDGNIGGYCTEHYVGDVEIGNVVNPLGTCIDVGFGLERINQIVNKAPPLSAIEEIVKAVNGIIACGVKPSNTLHGYVLRKLLRRLDKLGGKLDHEYFYSEQEKREEAKGRYHKLLHKHEDKPPEWWWETHGIDTEA